MTYGKSFYALAALCSLASVATTLILTFGADFYAPATTLEERIALLRDPVFQLRMWAYFVHPFVTFIAALGVYTIARRVNPGFALLGIVFVGLWAVTEALQQSLSLVALNWTWRGTYDAADAATQALFRSHMSMFDALWDGMFFLLVTGFMLGSLFFGLSLVRGRGFDRIIALFYLAIAGLSVLNLVDGYGGPAWAGMITGAAYPVIQPLARALLALWIWRRGPTAGVGVVSSTLT
jgi:hypothetical protein